MSFRIHLQIPTRPSGSLGMTASESRRVIHSALCGKPIYVKEGSLLRRAYLRNSNGCVHLCWRDSESNVQVLYLGKAFQQFPWNPRDFT